MTYLDYYKDNELFFHRSYDKSPEPIKFGMHAHDVYEFFYLISGKGFFSVEGHQYAIEPNSIVLLRANESHYMQITDSLPYERIVLHFFPHFIDSIDPDRVLLSPFDNRDLGMYNYYPSGLFSGKLIRSCLDNIIEIKNNDYNKRLSITTNFLTILNELNKSFTSEDFQLQFKSTNSQITEIISYINKNLYTDITTETICSHFFISKSQLCSLFKKSTNTTLWKYITTKRLINARHMLYNGASAYETCYQCGFKDYSTFYRRYKDYFNISPQDDQNSPYSN